VAAREGEGILITLGTTQWLDMTEVCETLQISRSTWEAVRRRHGGPPAGQLQLGRKLWWDRDALLDWLHDCETSSDIGTPAPRAPETARAGRQRGGAPMATASRSPFSAIGEVVDMSPR
jgi:predicted DNA-binding transcriptional regulator AlpA